MNFPVCSRVIMYSLSIIQHYYVLFYFTFIVNIPPVCLCITRVHIILYIFTCNSVTVSCPVVFVCLAVTCMNGSLLRVCGCSCRTSATLVRTLALGCSIPPLPQCVYDNRNNNDYSRRNWTSASASFHSTSRGGD